VLCRLATCCYGPFAIMCIRPTAVLPLVKRLCAEDADCGRRTGTLGDTRLSCKELSR
jgi:hypothetical protein